MNTNEHNFDNEANLPPLNGRSPFDLPSDYFASFERKLINKMENELELNEFPILSSIKKINTFILPENYFQSSEKTITSALELAEFPLLNAIKTQQLPNLSAEYINEFDATIKQKVELIDEIKEFNILYALNKTNVFRLPANYFDDLPMQIKDRIYKAQSSKIDLLDRVLDFIFGKKMALAFGLVLMIGLSVFIYQKTSMVNDSTDCKTLACLERSDLLNDNSVSGLNDDQIMDLVNIITLQKQLKSTKVEVDSLQEQEFILENTNTDQLIENL